MLYWARRAFGACALGGADPLGGSWWPVAPEEPAEPWIVDKLISSIHLHLRCGHMTGPKHVVYEILGTPN